MLNFNILFVMKNTKYNIFVRWVNYINKKLHKLDNTGYSTIPQRFEHVIGLSIVAISISLIGIIFMLGSIISLILDMVLSPTIFLWWIFTGKSHFRTFIDNWLKMFP